MIRFWDFKLTGRVAGVEQDAKSRRSAKIIGRSSRGLAL